MAIQTRIFALLLSGVLYGLSFPSFPQIPTGLLAWVAFVPVLLATQHEHSLKKYLFFTLPVFVIGISIGFWWTAYYHWQALLVCLLTQVPLVYAPFLIHFLVKKRFGFHQSLFLLPFCVAFSEWALHFLPIHLQVHSLAYTQANAIWLIQFADFSGMWGITFWVMTMNVFVIMAIQKRKKINYFYPILWLSLPLVYSLWVIKIQPRSVLGSLNAKTKVSIVQTNVDSYQKQDTAFTQRIFNEIVSLADSAVRTAQPDLLVLPETALPIPLFQDQNLLDFTKKAIVSWQTSVAIGFVEYPDTTKKHLFKNNALVFTPQLATFWDSLKIKPQDVKVYQKEYGLPFMEFMPFQPDSPSLRGSSLVRGHTPYIFSYSNFNNDKFNVALTICWEQMYTQKMADLVNSGAEFIALMNNDAWFGTTPGAKQLLSFTRIRAIENRRGVVRCSNGGISCFIDPFGRVSGQLPWFTSTIGTQEVLCVSKKSFYTQHPNWFPVFCGGVLLLLLAMNYRQSSH